MASEAVQHIEGELHRAFVDRMPSPVAIAEFAVDQCLSDRGADAAWMKAHFSVIADTAMLAAQERYLDAQRHAAKAAFFNVLVPMVGERATADEFVGILADNFQSLDKFFVSLGQARHPHVVKTFELLVCKLMAVAYAGAAQSVLRGQPDFILPSVEYFRRDPASCLVFSVKKNVRERWRQVAAEAMHPQAFYIATLDEEVSKLDLFEMEASHIYLVVTDRMKSGRSDYKVAANVLTFEDLCAQHLDPAVDRWRSAGVVRTPARATDSRGGSTPEKLPPGFGPATRPARRITAGLDQPSLFE
jgi:hypothetical protein